ncbi:hypothetical protein [Pseudorhodoferax sp. Leaf274]|uniref:hypothetical protein n=1 Tax=Pseudorhodoferax sp. Leaf274 TaxID=1736318 RepID=UPI00070245EA|nr:hypothetical protein [Pseudorhodoferax sp. Leaf274]KQP43899.1 hypothetical protein ASF44_28645 [Pseudorhodoferax sp. Leaf274]
MIRIQDLTGPASALRGYAEDDPQPMADFAISCTLEWETPTIVWVHALRGAGSRKLWREFVEALAERGVREIRARRAEGRRLPRAKPSECGGHFVMLVADLVERPPETGFGGL